MSLIRRFHTNDTVDLGPTVGYADCTECSCKRFHDLKTESKGILSAFQHCWSQAVSVKGSVGEDSRSVRGVRTPFLWVLRHMWWRLCLFVVLVPGTVFPAKLPRLREISCASLWDPITTGPVSCWYSFRERRGEEGHWTLSWCPSHSSQPCVYTSALITLVLGCVDGLEYVGWRRLQ